VLANPPDWLRASLFLAMPPAWLRARLVPLGGLEPTTPSLRRQRQPRGKALGSRCLEPVRGRCSTPSQAGPKGAERTFSGFSELTRFSSVAARDLTSSRPTAACQKLSHNRWKADASLLRGTPSRRSGARNTFTPPSLVTVTINSDFCHGFTLAASHLAAAKLASSNPQSAALGALIRAQRQLIKWRVVALRPV
jgi:hypothetical protein